VFQAMIVCLGVLVFTYAMFHIVGSRTLAISLLGGNSKVTQAQINSTIKEYDLNANIFVQIYHALDRIVIHGDLGRSAQQNQTVTSLIGVALPRSLLLVGFSTVLAMVVALPLGVFQVVRRNKASDYVLTALSFIFYAVPAYLLGTLLIMAFAIHWHIFDPNIQSSEPTWSIATSWKQITLPMITLAAGTVAAFSRYMRSSMMDALTEDYIRTARAKGASEGRVLFRHAFRNALIAIITLFGLAIPTIAGGAVLVEDTFNYPGMGLLTVNAAVSSDIPIVVGTTLVATALTVAGSLVADILYAIADPRIRYASR
jgi:peptide/nickel transport system permease protein